MVRRPLLLLLIAFALGSFFHYSVWGEPTDANFPSFVVVFLLLGLCALVFNELFPAGRSLWLFLPPVYFAVMTWLTNDRPTSLTHRMVFAFTLFYLALWAVTYLDGLWRDYGFSDYLINFLRLVRSIFTLPFQMLRRCIRDLPPGWGCARSMIGFALFIAVPIAVSYTILLARGDLIYHKRLVDFLFFVSEEPFDFLKDLPAILLWSYLIIGVLLHAGTRSNNPGLRSYRGPIANRLLLFSRSSLALISMIVPLLFFMLIQIGYSWGGESFVSGEGIPSDAYLRNGFPWLAVAASLSFCLVYVFGAITQYPQDWHRWTHLGINTLIYGLEIFILGAALARLPLDPYWISRGEARVYAQGFLIWLGGLFTILILLDFVIRIVNLVPWWRDREFPFAALMWTTLLAAGASLLRVIGLI